MTTVTDILFDSPPKPVVDLADPRAQGSLSMRFRKQRDFKLRELMLEQRARVPGTMRVVDLGGTADYWDRVGFGWLQANDIDITCVNDRNAEFGATEHASGRVRCIVDNACEMAGHDAGSFDYVHSNSVIEHVGRWLDMRAFANQVRRLAPAYYVQTPYYWFPVDPHFHRMPFYHWLPESLRLKLLQRFKLGWAPAQPDVDRAMRLVGSAILLDCLQFQSLFPDAEHSFERFGGLAKSMIAARRG